MIDLHAHILPGFDDGVATVEEARDLARASAAEGVTAIAATPHVRGDYPTGPERMERGVAALRADFAERGIPIEIVHGGEIALERLWELPDDDVRRFTYAQLGGCLLVEFPYWGWPSLIERTLAELRARDVVPLVAHPERNDEVQARPERLASLVRNGALVQLTAASLDGRLGRAPRLCAFRLLELGLAHVLASDAHAPDVRGGGMAAAAAALEDPELAHRLTFEIPRTILAGEPVTG